MNRERPASSEYDARYGRYVDLVPEIDPPAAFAQQLRDTGALLAGISEATADASYAPGKWTVREVVGHVLDTERIFGYRLLSFARGDTAMLQRADQDLYMRNAEFSRYSLAEIVDEFALIRRSHESLIRHLPEDAWDRTGTVGGMSISVRAIAYLMLGHERHHLAIIQSRYLQDA
jgi:uncharacterized damage-inducible protein DinB